MRREKKRERNISYMYASYITAKTCMRETWFRSKEHQTYYNWSSRRLLPLLCTTVCMWFLEFVTYLHSKLMYSVPSPDRMSMAIYETYMDRNKKNRLLTEWTNSITFEKACLGQWWISGLWKLLLRNPNICIVTDKLWYTKKDVAFIGFL